MSEANAEDGPQGLDEPLAITNDTRLNIEFAFHSDCFFLRRSPTEPRFRPFNFKKIPPREKEKAWRGGTGRGLFVLYNTIVLKNNSRYTKTVDMNNSAKKLGDNIRRIRLAKDMTQGDLCRKLGLDRAYMSNVESGKKNPTLSTIEKFAKALAVKPKDLLE